MTPITQTGTKLFSLVKTFTGATPADAETAANLFITGTLDTDATYNYTVSSMTFYYNGTDNVCAILYTRYIIDTTAVEA